VPRSGEKAHNLAKDYFEVKAKEVACARSRFSGSYRSRHHSLAVSPFEKALELQEFIVQNQKTAIDVGNLAISYMAKGLYQKAEDLCQSFLQNIEDNFRVREHLTLHGVLTVPLAMIYYLS